MVINRWLYFDRFGTKYVNWWLYIKYKFRYYWMWCISFFFGTRTWTKWIYSFGSNVCNQCSRMVYKFSQIRIRSNFLWKTNCFFLLIFLINHGIFLALLPIINGLRNIGICHKNHPRLIWIWFPEICLQLDSWYICYVVVRFYFYIYCYLNTNLRKTCCYS